MIKKVRIENYKSLQDVTLDLQDVNLLIGANNSGKSNVLQAFHFFYQIIAHNTIPTKRGFERIKYNKANAEENTDPVSMALLFELNGKEGKYLAYKIELHDIDENASFCEFIGVSDSPSLNFQLDDYYEFREAYKKHKFKVVNYESLKNAGSVTELVKNPLYNKPAKNNFAILKKDNEFVNITNRNQDYHSRSLIYNNPNPNALEEEKYIKALFTSLKVYKPIPENFIREKQLTEDTFVNEDASNLISFLFNFSQNQRKAFAALERELHQCVSEFEAIGVPAFRMDEVNNNEVALHKIKFFDANEHDYWADEVSEGVLYFLALLSIIKQPDPPKLLMLEEPEKGIHPRRINEVIDYIFELADEKGIQIMLTTHSPMVVDKFSDFPENIFVFDKEKDQTIVRNLKTYILTGIDEKLEKENKAKIDLTEELGENWQMGFLNGVPND